MYNRDVSQQVQSLRRKLADAADGDAMFRLTTDFAFADWHDAIAVYMKTL